jgi:hypothetical protein
MLLCPPTPAQGGPMIVAPGWRPSLSLIPLCALNPKLWPFCACLHFKLWLYGHTSCAHAYDPVVTTVVV